MQLKTYNHFIEVKRIIVVNSLRRSFEVLKFSRGYSKIKLSSGKRGPFVALFVNGLHIPGTAEISAVLFLLCRLLSNRRDIWERSGNIMDTSKLIGKSVKHNTDG